MKRVHLIPCSCEILYIGETGCINQRIQEHVANIKQCRTCSSALVEHTEKTKHYVILRILRSLPRFIISIIVSLGIPLRLKKDVSRLIKMMVGR